MAPAPTEGFRSWGDRVGPSPLGRRGGWAAEKKGPKLYPFGLGAGEHVFSTVKTPVGFS